MDGKSFLKGRKYAAILTDTENKWVIDVTENRDAEAAGKVFNSLKMDTLKVKKAWDIREKLRNIWETDREDIAEKRIRRWYREAIASCLEPVKKVADLEQATLRH